MGSRFHRRGGGIHQSGESPRRGRLCADFDGRDDLEKAVAAAKNALSFWRKRSGPERGEFLHRMANILERRADEIAKTMTREMGKTLPEAKGETARGVALLRYYAGEGMRKVGDVIPSTDSGGLMFTTRVPLGVVGRDHPVEFSCGDPPLENGAGAGIRKHGGFQAGGGSGASPLPSWWNAWRKRGCRRGGQPGDGQRPGYWAGHRGPSGHQPHHLHRFR